LGSPGFKVNLIDDLAAYLAAYEYFIHLKVWKNNRRNIMEITNLAFIAGVILGSLAIVSVCWVWLSKQMLGIGGGVLSFVGVLLVGLSLWSKASVQFGQDGFRAEFERLQNDVKAVAESNKALSRKVKVVAEVTDINKTQFLQLTSVLNRKQTLSLDQLKMIDNPIKKAPKIIR
jgi:hypothetical protein